MSDVKGVPVGVDFRNNLLKAEKRYRSMRDDELARQYCLIINFIQNKEPAGKSFKNGVAAVDGTRYNETEFVLAMAKYELVEIEVSRRVVFGGFASYGHWTMLRDNVMKTLEETGVAKVG